MLIKEITSFGHWVEGKQREEREVYSSDMWKQVFIGEYFGVAAICSC